MPEKAQKIMVLAPVVTNKKGGHGQLIHHLKKEGFARLKIDGQICLIEDAQALDKKKAHSIDVVVDRLILKQGIEQRLTDSVETALSLAEGQVIIDNLDLKKQTLFSEAATCHTCGIFYPQFFPASFSFNSPQGACTHCDGLGHLKEFHPAKIVPNPHLSLRQGAVLPWAGKDSVRHMEFLDALVTHYNEDIYTPFKDLSTDFQKIILFGSGTHKIPFYVEQAGKKIVYEKPFEGVIEQLARRFRDTKSPSVKQELGKYMGHKVCSKCNGSRLNPGASAVQVADKTIQQIAAMSVKQAADFVNSLHLSGREKAVSESILGELSQRLSFMEDVGLDYLTLDRSAATLSGGESQRIRLATQIGSKLSGVLYVLDEPSIGLHQRDNARLLSTLMHLKNLGNTVLVVEHDEETILAADHIIDVGPKAGVKGGHVMFSGPPEDLVKASCLTGLYLSGKRKIPVPENRRTGSGNFLTVQKASENNLKDIDVSFPLGCLTCVTGVSGSGKSTLVLSTLYQALASRINRSERPVGKHQAISGIEYIDRVIHIDQSPIGKTPRSNPGTYTGILTHIRELFAKTPEAKARGYKSGRFSFNIKGGRCESCKGDGIVKIEMHFLPDVYVTCDVCKGRQFNRETLEIKYKGNNIAQVLDMTINQAFGFFDNMASIRDTLSTLVETGLGYIKMGQAATTLSGGEAQRIKIARELSKKSTGKTLYILDEPTTGLHTDDIKRLLAVLDKLVDAGNTVVVIEHHLDVIKCADYVIDLGPDGGDQGGQIIAQGTPEQVARTPLSHTGFYLNRVLAD